MHKPEYCVCQFLGMVKNFNQMKKSLLFFALFSLFLVSCQTGNEDPELSVTEVKLTLNKFGIFSDGEDKITFSAELKDGTDVTLESEFYLDNELLEVNEYSSTTVGNHEVYALYKKVKSHVEIIGVIEKQESPARFTTKVLVEDFTGSWCGYCPRVAYKLEEAANKNPNIITVGVHYGDKMEYKLVNQMISVYGITGFPTAVLNRFSAWSESENELNLSLTREAGLGIAIATAQNGTDLDVTVEVGFAKTYNNDLALVVYLVEDGIVDPQRNYMNADATSPWYQAGDPISNYVHNHVLRVALTDIFGYTIPNYQTLERNTFTAVLSASTLGYNLQNLHVVAFVLEAAGSKNAQNVQIVKAGQIVDFD